MLWQEIYNNLFDFFNNDVMIDFISFLNQIVNSLFSLFRENTVITITLNDFINCLTVLLVAFVFKLILVIFKKFFVSIMNLLQGKEYNADEDIIKIKKRRK